MRSDWLTVSPMEGMDRPKVRVRPKEHFSEAELHALVDSCRGRGYDDVRDAAILRFLMSTGVRLAELANLTLDDIDLKCGTAAVTGKGGRTRTVRIGRNVAAAVQKYLRFRAAHDHADKPLLWLGQKGPLTRGGIHLMLLRRGRMASVPGVSAHRFRHSWAHYFRLTGGSIVNLEALGGWAPNSPMTRHYGATALAEEALGQSDAYSVGERI